MTGGRGAAAAGDSRPLWPSGLPPAGCFRWPAAHAPAAGRHHGPCLVGRLGGGSSRGRGRDGLLHRRRPLTASLRQPQLHLRASVGGNAHGQPLACAPTQQATVRQPGSRQAWGDWVHRRAALPPSPRRRLPAATAAAAPPAAAGPTHLVVAPPLLAQLVGPAGRAAGARGRLGAGALVRCRRPIPGGAGAPYTAARCGLKGPPATRPRVADECRERHEVAVANSRALG